MTVVYKCEEHGYSGCVTCENRKEGKEANCIGCPANKGDCPLTRNILMRGNEPDPAFAVCNYKREEKAIQDSGDRREFDTGAVRDMAEGKGLMVVMPPAALLRLSTHYEHGAKKYGMYNWQKGIPVTSFMDSTLRHIYKYLDGWDDEDHLAAAAFNILGAMEMEAKEPEMQDVPNREGKKSFNYPGCGSTLKAGDK